MIKFNPSVKEITNWRVVDVDELLDKRRFAHSAEAEHYDAHELLVYRKRGHTCHSAQSPGSTQFFAIRTSRCVVY